MIVFGTHFLIKSKREISPYSNSLRITSQVKKLEYGDYNISVGQVISHICPVSLRAHRKRHSITFVNYV